MAQPPPPTTVYARYCLGLCLGGAYTNDGTNSSVTFYTGLGIGGSAGVSSGAAATTGEVDLQGRASLGLRPWFTLDGMAQLSQQFGTPFDTTMPQASPGVAFRGTASIGPPEYPQWWASPGAVASWSPDSPLSVQPFMGAGYSFGMEASTVLAWSFPLPGSNSNPNAQIGTPFAITLPDGTMLVDGIPSFPSSAYAPQQSAPAPAAAPPAAPAISPPDVIQPSSFPFDGIQSWPLPAAPASAPAPVAAVSGTDSAGVISDIPNPPLNQPTQLAATQPAAVTVTPISSDNTTGTGSSTGDVATPIVNASVDPTSGFDGGTGTG
ncbi:MAG TPA: hypothetical protein VF482_00080 [Trebonia sp.]